MTYECPTTLSFIPDSVCMICDLVPFKGLKGNKSQIIHTRYNGTSATSLLTLRTSSVEASPVTDPYRAILLDVAEGSYNLACDESGDGFKFLLIKGAIRQKNIKRKIIINSYDNFCHSFSFCVSYSYLLVSVVRSLPSIL